MACIAFLTKYDCNPLFGGIERVTDLLSRELGRRGHTVYQISIIKSDRRQNYNFPCERYHLISSDVASKQNRDELERLVRELRIDIIINQFGLSREESLLFTDIDRKKVINISCLHSSPFGSVEYISQRLKNIHSEWSYLFRLPFIPYYKWKMLNSGMNQLRLISKRSDCIVTLSQSYSQIIKSTIRDFPDILESIPNPISLTEHNQSIERKGKIVLFVGRLDKEEKSPQFLIPIWKRLYPMHQDWHLYVLGDGDCMSELKHKSRKLKNIHYLGQQAPEPYYRKASILFMTSTNEGFSMVLLEAMKYGVIPMAFACSSGICDIIDNEVDGFLIKPFDVKEYASKAAMLMDNPSKCAVMSDCAQRNVYRYSIQSVTDQWEALFNRLQR